MSRAERLLGLLEELRRRRRPAPGASLAAAMGVSIRTLYRDIASLRAQGAAIEGEPGIGYVLRPGFLLPPLVFTEEEIEALVLGSRWVAGRADPHLALAAQNALSRIGAVLPANLLDRLQADELIVGPPTIAMTDAVDLPAIRRAIRFEKKILLTYRDVSGTQSERLIWPFMLGYFDGSRLVSAWCELRGSIRHFRADRIVGLEETGDRYPRRRHELRKEWQQIERRCTS